MMATLASNELKWVNILNVVLTVSSVYRAAVCIAHFEQINCSNSTLKIPEQ